MLLAAMVFKLEVLEAAKLPMTHGRLLHAALLNTVRELQPDISAAMHDSLVKNFSSGLLQLKEKPVNGNYALQGGQVVYWRVTALGEEVAQTVFSVKPDTVLRVGRAMFKVLEVICNQQRMRDTGVVATEELFAGCSQLPPMRRLRLEFITPASFKVDQFDYAFPRPELIFTSLANRWNELAGEVQLDVIALKELSQKLIPELWNGSSKRIALTPERGLNGFIGTFSFNLQAIPEEYRFIFILLCEFAQFSGIGRYTAQGLGRVRIAYTTDKFNK